MEDDLLHSHDLLPALLDGVVVLPHHYLPVPGLLAPVEAVAGAEHPLVADQAAPHLRYACHGQEPGTAS